LKQRSRKKKIEFFENYAKVNGFDPYIPANWYAQSRHHFYALKGSQKMMYHKIMFHYNHNLSSALIDLLPHVGFVSSSFKYV